MLAWFRANGRSLAVAVFVVLAAAGGANVAGHGPIGHDDHGPLLIVHDAAAHAFTDGSAAPREEPLHCVLCHLTRTVRPTLHLAHHAPAHDDRTQVLRRPTLRVAAVFPAAEPPLRSPPVSL
jgi:hypothetical protein